ncbi:MAG: electron transport complex subunit RsxC, partial [Natronospirillum sp.]
MNLFRWLSGQADEPEFFDFHGGVHPPENKAQSLQASILPAPLQATYTVPLNQHIGAFAVPVVAVGDKVLKGQLIASAAGFISAPSHAPTSGTVTAIEDRPVPHASGLTATCIVIAADGADTWRAREPWRNLKDHQHNELLARIQQAGLTGLGGASFPTAVKLAGDREHIDTLIVNGTECEPYITADHSLMRERATAIYEGIAVVHELYEFARILVGIEDNKPDAIAAMRAAVPDALKDRIQIRVFPTKYPSGGEKQLIYLLTGREVPSGGLPLDLGMLCHNVGTLAALADAVWRDEPLIRRVTTLTGNAVARPGNYDVLIGTA